jgi:hypothetical protein
MNEATSVYAFLANQSYKYNYPNQRITDEVPTEVGVATSIDRSSADWQQVVSQNAPQQTDLSHAMAPTSQTEAPPAHSPHSLSRQE